MPFTYCVIKQNSVCERSSTDKPYIFPKSQMSGDQMSLVVRKPVFGVSDQVRHKPGCTATEDGSVEA